MTNSILIIPKPYNEPVKMYAPAQIHHLNF